MMMKFFYKICYTKQFNKLIVLCFDKLEMIVSSKFNKKEESFFKKKVESEFEWNIILCSTSN
jgi:hypothetical protein